MPIEPTQLTVPLATITVYGMPAPQGSKKFLGIKGGKGIMVEMSDKVKPWRHDVVYACKDWIEKSDPIERQLPFDGPLALKVVFTLPKPSSAPRRKKSWPCKKPDLSKLIRSTEDAMKTAGLIRDDARIVRYDLLEKCYPNEAPNALSSPGAWIQVSQVHDR